MSMVCHLFVAVVVALVFPILATPAFAQKRGRPSQITQPKVVIPMPGSVMDMALRSDGIQVAIVTATGEVGLWTIPDGKKVRGFQDLGEQARIALSPDDKLLAGGGTGRVVIWDASTGAVKYRCPAKPRRVRQLRFSPDGKTLAIVGELNGPSAAMLWTPATGKLTAFPSPAQSAITREAVLALVFAPDGHSLFYASKIEGVRSRVSDGTTTHWLKKRDLKTGKDKVLYSQYSNSPYSYTWRLALSPDGKTLVYGDKSQFDAASGRRRPGFSYDGTALGFSPGGGTVAANAGPGVTLSDLETGERLLVLSPHTTRSNTEWVAPAFTPDGRLLVTPGEGETLWLWDIADFIKGRKGK